MTPKISDFGLARLYNDDQTHKETSIIAGTCGYMAPEYAMHGMYSAKLDVYSFGVLLLEIVTGRKNSSFCQNQLAANLISYARQHWAKGEVEALKDPALKDTCLEQMSRCIHIGLLCVQEDPINRPDMRVVNLMLTYNSITVPSLSRLHIRTTFLPSEKIRTEPKMGTIDDILNS
ncbi:cysteine-rich RECEPTOR-like kinase [Rhynchospora pubera]|uniref:Cysteine-rich RECEPTOR-like kinase n=1 Tax=Rhynchospora pubera TaxID=906938 RepID=A0AAV8DTX2_9POAL|nr:cysteine-rich RECEPTOR-like kinase [Rhynchospora pubera]